MHYNLQHYPVERSFQLWVAAEDAHIRNLCFPIPATCGLKEGVVGKSDFGLVLELLVLQRNCSCQLSFGFTKLTAVSVFRFSFLHHCVLFNICAL